MNKRSSQIEIVSVVSKDERCRFSYTKTWESDKPKALFILMNPSKGTELKLDNTIVNINNYCVDEGFGAFRIVNLFPLMATNPKELSGNFTLETDRNMKTISDSIDEFDLILIAWGTERKYVQRKREVEELLISKRINPDKILCWVDSEERYPKHLRILSKKWKLEPYKFQFIE